MIRFVRLLDIATERDRLRLAAARELFRRAFAEEPEEFDRIEALLLGRRQENNVEPALLLAEDQRGRILGFALTLYFPDLRYGFLDWIASDPARPARGIGGALYEAGREYLQNKGARGLFLDVPPDEPEKLKRPDRARVNGKRLAFYERYGARPVAGTLYDVLPLAEKHHYLTFLVWDALGHKGALRRAEARKAVRAILIRRYGVPADAPALARIVDSFRDDPAAIRPPRYARAETSAPASGAWLRPIKVLVPEHHRIHHLRQKGYVERPVRVDAVLRGLEGLPYEQRRVRHFRRAAVQAVHDPHLVAYLEAVCRRLGPDDLVYPEVFPIRRPERRPRELEVRAGYFCADTFTPLTQNAYAAARAAVDCALSGAELLSGGERLAYALCRPPGHHAERRVYGGFCYFNNAAIAAHRLSAEGPVALLDIDYHHGNGSQDIFYERADVLTLSIHGHPNRSYPHFSGFADEHGADAGHRHNRNYPLRAGIDDAAYLAVLDDALRLVRRHGPRWLVVSLGFDIMRGDPTGSFLVSVRGMSQIGARIGALGLPTLVVQEGGYSVWNLRRGAHAFFSGLLRGFYRGAAAERPPAAVSAGRERTP